jgi:hypothetical protein
MSGTTLPKIRNELRKRAMITGEPFWFACRLCAFCHPFPVFLPPNPIANYQEFTCTVDLYQISVLYLALNNNLSYSSTSLCIGLFNVLRRRKYGKHRHAVSALDHTLWPRSDSQIMQRFQLTGYQQCIDPIRRIDTFKWTCSGCMQLVTS